jgi:hypothetical protein
MFLEVGTNKKSKVPHLWRLTAGFTSWRSELDSQAVRVGFVEEKLQRDRFCLRCTFGFWSLFFMGTIQFGTWLRHFGESRCLQPHHTTVVTHQSKQCHLSADNNTTIIETIKSNRLKRTVHCNTHGGKWDMYTQVYSGILMGRRHKRRGKDNIKVVF